MPSKKPNLLQYEQEAIQSGFEHIAGVDEAGRGPLAGPVVAAAVLFEPEYEHTRILTDFAGLTDSKALSEAKRNAFFDQISTHAQIKIGIGVVDPLVIDEINILKATHLAMADALKQVPADFALIDGLPVKGLPCGSRAIVKGDALSLSISAASIIAKVTRDRIMVQLSEMYPAYGFEKHKGYGTRQHLDALRRCGATPVHRKSFKPVAELDQLDLGLL